MSEFELKNDFESEVLQESTRQPVLVDFWAAWCGPCRTLGPTLEKLASEAQGRFKLVKVDTEAHTEIAQHFRIQSIPAVKLFVDGRVAAEFVGALPEARIRAWLDQEIPSDTERLFHAAEAILAAGEIERARESLEIVLQADPEHLGARCRLAEITLFSDPDAARAYLEPIASIEEGKDRVEELLQLARQAMLVDAKLLKTVEGHQPKAKWVDLYLEGNRALARQDFAAALRAWIEVLTFDRELDDDGARKACIALFHYLGEDHPLTRELNSAFSSALF